MFAFAPYGRVKELFGHIQRLEDRLDKAAVIPMPELRAIHAEIARLKDEVARLEKSGP